MLDTARSSEKSHNEFLLSLRSIPIGPHLPSQEKFYTTEHKNTQDMPLIPLN